MNVWWTVVLLVASGVEFPEKGRLGDARRERIQVAGQERTYLWRDGAPTATQKPLVIYLHGGTQTDEQAWRQTSFPTLAQRDGFVFVAPQGQSNQWNDGRPETLSGNRSNADDVAFLRALIAHMQEHHGVDPKRVYLAGVSNGGVMTMRFACEAGDLLRAAAAGIANLPRNAADTCAKGKGLPWMLLHGTEDKLMPYAGNADVESAERTFNFWASRAGCKPKEERNRLPHRDPKDPTWAEQRTRLACPGEPSIHLVLHGAGHVAPNSHFGPLIERALGKSNQDVDLGEAMWEFFRRAGR